MWLQKFSEEVLERMEVDKKHVRFGIHVWESWEEYAYAFVWQQSEVLVVMLTVVCSPRRHTWMHTPQGHVASC